MHGTRERRLDRRAAALKVFEVAVVAPNMVTLGAAVVRDHAELIASKWHELLIWVLIIAVIELLPVPMWRGQVVSLGFPLLMVVAFVYPPAVAASVAFLAACDPREVRREVDVLRALFNRCQIALAIAGAGDVSLDDLNGDLAIRRDGFATEIRALASRSLVARVIDDQVMSPRA